MKKSSVVIGVALGILVSGAAMALEPFSLDDYSFENADGSFAFSVSAGVLALEGREHIFTTTGSTNNLSLLIWQSVSPMVSAEAKSTFAGGWTVMAEGRVAASGFGYMEDYDWIAPNNPSFAPDDWSHRSQHPNTNLDWYVDASVAVGYDFDLRDGINVNFNGGFAYTDVQWTAADGSYIYSVGGFRNSSGSISGVGITYRQQLPSVFVGLDTSIERGPLTIDLGMRGGIAFMQQATDQHFLRVPPLLFENPMMPAPTLGGSAKLTYAFNDNFGVFIDARMDKKFLARGAQNVSNLNTGAPLSAVADVMGAELLSGSISAGLKGSFN